MTYQEKEVYIQRLKNQIVQSDRAIKDLERYSIDLIPDRKSQYLKNLEEAITHLEVLKDKIEILKEEESDDYAWEEMIIEINNDWTDLQRSLKEAVATISY
ncbi:MAG: hypothetical protein GF384_05365 [Elusimicrobia bacterium]|nr:hypothetical protein [Elusimicrobiota bacterium]